MTVNKITNAPTQNETIEKINEIIDNLGGTSTDVQVNGTSITSNGVANLVTNTAYDSSSNKIATMSDIPDAQVQSNWNETNTSSKAYIQNKPTIPTVPTNVSAFTNDAGYLTQHQSLSGYQTTSNLVTSISSSSTNSQYPSALCVYNALQSAGSAITIDYSGV